MPLSIISIAKNSLKFTSIKTFSALVGLGVTLYAATILLPEEYGTYGLLILWLTYVNLATPGTNVAASREIPILLGKGQEKNAIRVQNISLSVELLFTIVPAAVIIIAAFFYTETVMRIGLLIIAVGFVATRLSTLWANMIFVRERFNTVAMVNIIIAVVAPIVVFASLPWLKVYAMILGVPAAFIIAAVYYLAKGNIGYRFTLDRREITRLTKVGIVLQGLTIVIMAFRMADRTIIASMLSLEQLGLYVFATGFLTYGLSIFEDFARVLQPILWRHAGTAESVFKGFQDTRRIAVYLALGTGIVTPLAQMVFTLIATLITHKYVDGIPIFNVLSYNLYLMAVAIIPQLILNSSLVNKQNRVLLFYGIGLVVSIGLDILVIRLGYGVIGVAWVAVGAQGVVTVILYYLIKNYVFDKAAEFRKFALIIAIPFVVSLPFYFIHVYLRSISIGTLAFTGMSLAAQAVIWTLVIFVFYRDYVSRAEFRLLIQEIKAIIPRSRPNDQNLPGSG
jgi:O-antigen/teichoic acid export membrane protein